MPAQRQRTEIHCSDRSVPSGVNDESYDAAVDLVREQAQQTYTGAGIGGR